jgi:hypothetical protein
MTIALGLLAPLGYGVFTAIGAALLLGAIAAPHTFDVPETATDTKARTRLSALVQLPSCATTTRELGDEGRYSGLDLLASDQFR